MPLYRRSQSGPWWYRFHVGGIEYRASTGADSRREAEEVERAARAAVESSATRGAGGAAVDLAQLAEWDVSRAQAEGVTAPTVAQIERNWGHLARVLGGRTEAQTVRYQHLEGYVALRRQEGARGQTIRREIQALRRGLEAARKRGRLHRVLADWPEVRSDPAHEGKRGKLIPPGILSRWLGELEGDAQDQALVALLTGLRSQELRRLRWEWVEPTDSGPTPAILRLPAGSTKSRQERVVGLPAAVLEVLERRAQVAQGGPLLPGEHKTAYRLASKRAKWHRTITLRDLRHTHATISAHATGDAAGTQAALGHSDLATTQRYLSATVDRAAGAAAAVARALDWHTPPGTAAGRGANNPGSKWSGRQDSNLRPSAPEANDPLLAHVAACAWCRAMAAECMSLHKGSEGDLAQGLAQVAPEQVRRMTA